MMARPPGAGYGPQVVPAVGMSAVAVRQVDASPAPEQLSACTAGVVANGSAIA
jgi:hypothetical protein